MSAGIICDNCGEGLAVDKHGEDDSGEFAAWVTIGTTYKTFDACTISCAEDLLHGPVREAAHAALDAIVRVVRVLRGEDDGEDEATS